MRTCNVQNKLYNIYVWGWVGDWVCGVGVGVSGWGFGGLARHVCVSKLFINFQNINRHLFLLNSTKLC